MSTRLSRYFEQKRLEKGLKPGQLARLAGCANVPKSGDRIRHFELSGYVQQELFEKITAALEISADDIQELVEQDRMEHFEACTAWLNEPVQPSVSVHYGGRSLPPEITTMEEAERWTSAFALEVKQRCWLLWNRRFSALFHWDGTLIERRETLPGTPPGPFRGRHRFSHSITTWKQEPNTGDIPKVKKQESTWTQECEECEWKADTKNTKHEVCPSCGGFVARLSDPPTCRVCGDKTEPAGASHLGASWACPKGHYEEMLTERGHWCYINGVYHEIEKR
jgi:hypothetical protein